MVGRKCKHSLRVRSRHKQVHKSKTLTRDHRLYLQGSSSYTMLPLNKTNHRKNNHNSVTREHMARMAKAGRKTKIVSNQALSKQHAHNTKLHWADDCHIQLRMGLAYLQQLLGCAFDAIDRYYAVVSLNFFVLIAFIPLRNWPSLHAFD